MTGSSRYGEVACTLLSMAFYSMKSSFLKNLFSLNRKLTKQSTKHLLNREPGEQDCGEVTGAGIEKKWCVTITVPFGPIWLRNLKMCSNMQCFRIPFKPYCSKMAKRDTYGNTTHC